MSQPRKITAFFSKKQTETDPRPSTSTAPDDNSDSDTEVALIDLSRERSPIKRVHGMEASSSQSTHSESPYAEGQATARTRKFPKSWLQQFPWMGYDEVDNIMFCKDCKQFGVEGSWSSGNNNFRMKTVKDHIISDVHKTAVTSRQPGQMTIGPQLQKEKLERKRAIITALKAAYWLAKEEMPNKKYGSLVSFLQELNLKEANYLNRGKNATYTSPDVYNQLIECLSKVIWRQLKSSIRQSPTIGIGIDESTDRAQEKHVAIIVRHISREGKVLTNFLALEKIHEGTAKANYEALDYVLKMLEIPWTKVVGLGADGASVMSGERNGLRSYVETQNPHCTYVHCVCHRLNLAVSQACKAFPEMETVSKILTAIYNFVNQSPKKHQEFKDIAALLDTDVVKFKKIFEVRWLSMGNSVLAVLRNYEPLTILLSQEADRGDPVAVGLLQQLTSFLYLALLFLSADTLTATNHLSRIFQFRDVSFGAIRNSLKDCKENLVSFKTKNGPHLTDFITELEEGDPTIFKGQNIRKQPTGRGQHLSLTERFEKVREDFLQEILDNIESRFPHAMLLDAFQIYDPIAYPENSESLFFWGNDHLNTLLDFYGQSKENKEGVRFNNLVDPDVAKGEFLPFKRLVHRNRTNDDDEGFMRPVDLFEKIFDARDRLGNRQIFPEMFKLMSISVTVMVGNAEAERVFSAQNRIKSKLRTGLTVKHLDHLIRISYGKTPSREFPFEEAANLFFEENRRI